jgi:cytochrome c
MSGKSANWVSSLTLVLGVLVLAGCGAPAEDPAADTSVTAASATPSTAGSTPALTVADKSSKPAVFGQCAACHSVEPGKNGIGPSLAGVVGRKAGAVPGFAYSQAMTGSGMVWDAASLDRYLTAPTKTLPGTKMSYAGLSDGAKRKELIEYLGTLK